MSVSRQIIDIVLNSLSLYLNDPRIVYERYRQQLNDLEARTDVPVRIALYEQTDTSKVKTDDFRTYMTTTTYMMDVSVDKSYVNLDAEYHELELLDLKDKIITWCKSNQIAALTGGNLGYFTYAGHTGLQRNPNFVTVTLLFSAQRDYFRDQLAPIVALPFSNY